MKKVLFIYPKLGNNIGKTQSHWFPFGIMGISSYLKKNNIDVKIIDNTFLNLNFSSLKQIIDDYNPNIIGLGALTVQRNDAIQLSEIIRKINKDILIVFGGVHFSYFPEDALKYCDICVIGEAENTFLEICQDKNLNDIDGIGYHNDNKTIFTKSRELKKNLDRFPLPAYDLIDVYKYDDTVTYKGTGIKNNSISMMTSRGCDGNCIFCASPFMWKRKIRFNSLDYVFNHIKYLVDSYNIKNIRFMDDSFVINKKRVYEFCDLIEKNKFKLNLQFLSSVKHVDYDLFCRMKSVGFYHVSLGIESGNQDILNLINKKTQIEDIKKSIDIIKKVGLNVECLYMVGNIGETEKTMNDTISFAHKLKTIVHVQIAIPYPGTKFYEIYKQYGHITTENFNNFTTDDPVFIPNTLNKEMLINARSRGNTRSAGIL